MDYFLKMNCHDKLPDIKFIYFSYNEKKEHNLQIFAGSIRFFRNGACGFGWNIH